MAYAQKAASSLQMAGSMLAQFQQSQALNDTSSSGPRPYQNWDRLNRIRTNKKIMGRYAA